MENIMHGHVEEKLKHMGTIKNRDTVSQTNEEMQ